MDIRPIPAFYCCYLLRSTVRPSSLYVGSTPHPARRLAQHNGMVKGGAVRTSRLALRPWEMTCIVAGFPSKIAALQFEWAWQNAHLTRHIPANERISFPTTRTKTSSRTGNIIKRPGRPRTSMIDKLSNLHLLLRVPYFRRWPLELRFFNPQAYQVWQNWCQRVDTQIDSGVKVLLDPSQPAEDIEEISSAQRPSKRRKVDLVGKGGVEGVDHTYARFHDVLEKAQFIFDDSDEHTCDVCRKTVRPKQDLLITCPHGHCMSVSHVTCLSERFLREDPSTDLVPKAGPCPSCDRSINWADAMCVTSLRARDKKDIQKLLSKKRRSEAATAVEILESESENYEEDEDDGLGTLTIEDVAHEDPDEDDDGDAASVTSPQSYSSTRPGRSGLDFEAKLPQRLEIVIEDSDDNS